MLIVQNPNFPTTTDENSGTMPGEFKTFLVLIKVSLMGNVVYSTEKGRLCSDCGRPVSSCQCEQLQKQKVLGSGKIRVRREVKGRGGKAVTVVSGLAMNEQELKDLCRAIKQKLGVGGAVKQSHIEIQGDHVAKVLEILKEKGFDAKKGGG